MNQVERLKGDLAKRFPEIRIELDKPVNEQGPWFLDVHRQGGLPPVVVEWRPDRGFGVSTPGEADFGTGPDEVYPNARAAYDRVVRLVLSGGKSEPPDAVRLAELRQGLGLSQSELAERAGMKQANLSRIENRGDVLVSTLAGIVGAMGAELVILARFPGDEGREVEIRLPAVQSDLGSASTFESIRRPSEGWAVRSPGDPLVGGYSMAARVAPVRESTPPTTPKAEMVTKKKKSAPKPGKTRSRRATRPES